MDGTAGLQMDVVGYVPDDIVGEAGEDPLVIAVAEPLEVRLHQALATDTAHTLRTSGCRNRHTLAMVTKNRSRRSPTACSPSPSRCS
jgi:hypothetical protein